MQSMADPLTAFFAHYYRRYPVNATFTGVHAFDGRLPAWSPDDLDVLSDEACALRSALGPEEPDVGALSETGARDRALARSALDVQIAELESQHFHRRNPSLVVGEAAFGVIALMTRPFAPAAVRIDSATARLAAVPAFFSGARRSLTAGIPEVWRDKTLRELEGADRLFGHCMQCWLAAEPVDGRRADRLLDAARGARAAAREFAAWLSHEAKAAPPAALACGPEMFDRLLTRGHWCMEARGSLLSRAEAALDEALARLDARARTATQGGWPEVQARLADAHPKVDDYLATYERVWHACRAHADACNLVTWPLDPIRYVPIPMHTRDAASYLYYLFYRSPAPFDRLPVHDYVVTPIDAEMPEDERSRRLRATNTSVITLNHVVHHGGIGHHVQNGHAYRGTSAIGKVAAVDCAARIGLFLGGTMAEGWACYATDLMDEVGFLSADESLAQQHTRARLIARAVADIRLHEGSLSFDQVVTLYRDRIAMAPEAAWAEACKNAMFPATAVMYWLGTDTLHALRRSRERIEGASFSLRRFHDMVLSYGSIPVPLIARLMA